MNLSQTHWISWSLRTLRISKTGITTISPSQGCVTSLNDRILIKEYTIVTK